MSDLLEEYRKYAVTALKKIQHPVTEESSGNRVGFTYLVGKKTSKKET